jgi:benzil reductase ((S)-benzoin forming)
MRLAIITGGSRGLGAALCEEYGSRGWQVLEFSRSAPFDFSVELDMSDLERVAVVVAEALESEAARGCSEVVGISNAAVLGPVGPVTRASPAAIAKHVDTNVTGAILFARAFVSAFEHQACAKTFVNISSGAAVKGHAGWSLYCASKAAMDNFVRALALEQATSEHPVRAIGVNPGVMDTGMQAAVRQSSPKDFPEVERYIRLQRQGMLAEPRVVAQRIARIVESRPEPGDVYPVSH